MGQVHELSERRRQATTWQGRACSTRSAPGKAGCGPERLEHEIRQNPLIDTRTTLEQLRLSTKLPRRVMVGLGLCRGDQVSAGVPLDLVGYLICAERIRAACDAQLVVLIADEHALQVGVPDLQVARQRARLIALCEQLIRLGLLTQVSLIRASDWHASAEFQTALARINEQLGALANSYVNRQLADMCALANRPGGLLKLGWALGDRERHSKRDEQAFDQRYRMLFGDQLPFVYCRPGRTLNPWRPKVSPYIVSDPHQRPIIEDRQGWSKLFEPTDSQLERSAQKGVRRQLKRIMRLVSQAGLGLTGSFEQRLQQLGDLLR
jgi:hypothetical protein